LDGVGSVEAICGKRPDQVAGDQDPLRAIGSRQENVNLARARVAVQIDQPVQALDLDLCQVQALVLQDVSAGLSPALAFGRGARRRQDSRGQTETHGTHDDPF